MKWDTEAPAIEYADEESKKRFSWTDEDNEALSHGNFKRHGGVFPMASDGNLIYILVQLYDEGSTEFKWEERKAICLEIYELTDDNKIKFLRAKQLSEEDSSKPFKG